MIKINTSLYQRQYDAAEQPCMCFLHCSLKHRPINPINVYDDPIVKMIKLVNSVLVNNIGYTYKPYITN